jgi:hypothetical protein
MTAQPTGESLARVHHAIMRGFVLHGRAPHYTELGAELCLAPDAALGAQRRLLELPEPWWADPGLDVLVTFRPFANVPTNYRISVDGRQRWYGQCGLESLAVSWLFPGKEVRIEARCPDCAAPLAVRMRDGVLLEALPETIVGHNNQPPGQAIGNWADA